MSHEPDPTCQLYGIPLHLHRSNRDANSVFLEGERAYRRHPPEVNDIKNVISFKTKDSSVNRSSLCEVPEDVLICEATGERKKYYVAEFPVDFFVGKKWIKEAAGDSPAAEITIEVQHAPLRCNYAHCNLIFKVDGVEMPEIKTGSIKAEIRRAMEPVLQRLVPEVGPWIKISVEESVSPPDRD